MVLFTNTSSSFSCFDKCLCTTQANLSLIECYDNQPSDFNSSETDFLSISGQEIELLEPLQNIKVKNNGKILISGIQVFADNFLRGVSCPGRFGFSVENSDLTSLQFRSPFQNSNLTFVELKGCKLGQFILVSGFYGSDIDELIIRNPTEDSLAPAFRRGSLIGRVKLRKLRLEDGGRVFKENSLTGRFGLDAIFLNRILFEFLEELQVVNTAIEFIEAGCLEGLEYLRVVRLENVGLKEVLEAGVSWLVGGRLERVFVGREPDMIGMSNDFLCYFIDLNYGQETGKGVKIFSCYIN